MVVKCSSYVGSSMFFRSWLFILYVHMNLLLRFVCYALSINQPLWAFYRAWNICSLCIEIQWRIQLDGNIDSLWQGKMKHSLIVFSAKSLQTSNTIQYTISGPNFYDIDHNKKYKSNKQDHVLGVPVPACSAQCQCMTSFTSWTKPTLSQLVESHLLLQVCASHFAKVWVILCH